MLAQGAIFTYTGLQSLPVPGEISVPGEMPAFRGFNTAGDCLFPAGHTIPHLLTKLPFPKPYPRGKKGLWAMEGGAAA